MSTKFNNHSLNETFKVMGSSQTRTVASEFVIKGMKAVRTVDDKAKALEQRSEEQRTLGKHIDRVIYEAQTAQEGATLGCAGSGVCPAIGRTMARVLGLSHQRQAVATSPLATASEGPSKRASGSEVSRAVFALAPSLKKTPQTKLAAATQSMLVRVQSLEKRALEAREAAQTQMKAEKKQDALRHLKRAKLLEKQAASTQTALDALEAQSDMLEQTALQKEVAVALGATAKSLKKEKGLLSKAEDAVDAASEMRDLHDDITQVMSGLGDATSNDFDEDDLMLELEQMAELAVCDVEDATFSDVSAHALTEDSAVASEMIQAAKDLEASHRAYDEIESIRQKLPSAPKKTLPQERQGLLGQA